MNRTLGRTFGTPAVALIVILITLFPRTASAQAHVTLTGTPILDPACATPPPLGTLVMNFGSPSEAYAWQFGGIQAADYGAFAERLTGPGPTATVNGIRVYLTTNSTVASSSADAYLWADWGGVPGPVLHVAPMNLTSAPVTWPNVSCYDFAIRPTTVGGSFFIGFWGNWAGSAAPWFIAGDTNTSTNGFPMTNIAPGVGFPTGWNDASLVFLDGGSGESRPSGRVSSLGIGAWIEEEPTPVRESTWGNIKELFKP